MKRNSWFLLGLLFTLVATGPGAHAQTRVDTYTALKAKQQWAEALQVIRQEIAAPSARTPSYLANLRIIAISAIVDVANQSGLQIGLDTEASRYYREALQYASGDADREAMVQKVYARYSAMVAQSKINTYTALKARQQWAEALAVIREEVASPQLSTPIHLANVRIIAIGALGDFATHRGLQPGMDEEAARYYREALKYVSGDEQREGNVRQVFPRYFSNTQRNGRALPYLRENLEYWKGRSNSYMRFLTLDGLASAYADMGEAALRDHYREQALSTAASYFASEKATPNQWLQYKTVVEKRMDNLTATRSVEEIDRLWLIARDINERFVRPKSPSYRRAATYFSVAGAHNRAQQLHAQARQIWEKEAAAISDDLRKMFEADLDMAEGLVLYGAGRYLEASEAMERAHRVQAEAGARVAEGMANNRFRGLAFESIGELDKAAEAFQISIKGSEAMRQSYNVAERAAFFRSAVQRSYHGLIRVSARQAARDGGIERFWESVQASEMVRARQLGDLFDPNAPALVSREALERIRAGLGAGRAVLYFTVADQSLVILGLAHDRHIAVVQPIDDSFSDSLRRLARDLARPQSSTESIETRLQQISGTVLGPVAELLQSRNELVVLPDGVLNLVPFDLLSADARTYRPLLDTHRVKLAPSLRFVGRSLPAPRDTSLFALADPNYQQPTAVAGVDHAELAAATRGSRYLDYFQRLPETRTEVEAIKGTFSDARVQTLYGEQATESALKRTNLMGFSYLHFATHGILGGEVPGVGEPALVLSAEQGEDGFLTASEVAALKMDAQLTVLSACNTGSGEYVTGEGVLGLSRAFLIAGSRAVVVSLWPVASKATERLMVKFYANLRSGQDPHEALRNAKLSFIEEARGPERHPMFWAAFVVFGA